MAGQNFPDHRVSLLIACFDQLTVLKPKDTVYCDIWQRKAANILLWEARTIIAWQTNETNKQLLKLLLIN